MKSKIRVEYDYDTREPYLQLYLESNPEDPDLKDSMLKYFIQHATSSVGNEIKPSLTIVYPSINPDNGCPQIRFVDPYKNGETGPQHADPWTYEKALSLLDRAYSMLFGTHAYAVPAQESLKEDIKKFRLYDDKA